MIQGRMVRLGTGTGDPGYRFADEFHPSFAGMTRRVKLSMANAGPNTNGSQFFPHRCADTPGWITKHAIFGEVVEGLDLAIKISELPRGANDKPKQPVVPENAEDRAGSDSRRSCHV